MNQLTVPILKSICPSASEVKLGLYIPFLNGMMPLYGINTLLRMRHFIAQVAHESGSFNTVEENLNYSPNGLMRVFSKYFTLATVNQYAFQPEKIGNRVYANRMGNGNEESGDGSKYKGRGLIQTTGKDNYTLLRIDLLIDCINHPELIILPKNAVESACWFWKHNGLNELADTDNINAITHKINGGVNGLAERINFYKLAQKYIV
jgi:putative chitinase